MEIPKFYFVKKYIFAVIFLLFITGFGVGDILSYKWDYIKMVSRFTNARSFNDIKTAINKAESSISSDIMGKMYYIELYGFTQRVFGKQEFNNFAYIQDKNRMLYYGSVTEQPLDDLETYADNVRRLNEYIEGKGAHLLVVIPPSKVMYNIRGYNNSAPVNDPNNRTDKFMSQLQQRGIHALDLRESMYQTALPLDEIFFKTDHHWTPLAAFYAFKDIINEMNRLYGADIDPDNYYRDLSNYYKYTYPNSFLGSIGRHTGVIYSGLDDYTFYWPECDMEFEWNDVQHNEISKGTYEEVILKYDRLGEKEIYNLSMGSVYLHEVVDEEKLINKSNTDAPKLTVLRDSYFTPIAAFMAPLFSEIDMMWTHGSEGLDMEKYIREGEYDYVILEVYPYNLDKDSFNFFHAPKQEK